MKHHKLSSIGALFVLIIAFISLGLTVKYTTLEEITGNSDLILTGKVVSSESRWEEKNIFTYYKIEVDQRLKGSVRESSVFVKQLGGTVGEISQEIAGSPRLKKDSEVFLFLVDWKNNYWINSIVLGYYEIITKDGSRVAVNNFNNVQFVDSKSGKVIEDRSSIKTEYELNSLRTEVEKLVKKQEAK